MRCMFYDLFMFQTLCSNTRISSLRCLRFLPDILGHEFLKYMFCDEIRLSVEFVTVGFLGVCRQYCCDRFPVSWRADEATPERGTPIIEH